MAWLDSINRERGGDGRAALEHCLLSADNNIFRVPWEDVVQPEFVSKPSKMPQSVLGNGTVKGVDGSREDSDTEHEDRSRRGILIHTSMDQTEESANQSRGVKLIPALDKQYTKDSSGRSSSSTADDSEGEYVELAEIELPRFSPQKGSLTQSISMNYRNLHKPRTSELSVLQPNTNSSQSVIKNTLCSQSIVCAMLIEENLSDPLQPVITSTTPADAPNPQQQMDQFKATCATATGTANSDSVPEHESERECEPESTDKTALCDSKTKNVSSSDTEILTAANVLEKVNTNEGSNSEQSMINDNTTDLENTIVDVKTVESEITMDSNLRDMQNVSIGESELIKPENTKENSGAEVQVPTMNGDSTDLEKTIVDVSSVESQIETDSNSREEQDISLPESELMEFAESVEKQIEAQAEACQIQNSTDTEGQPESEDKDDVNRLVCEPAASESGPCGRESSPGLCNVEKGRLGSACPVGQQVDWAFVPTECGEGQVTAVGLGQERTESSEEDESKSRCEGDTNAVTEQEVKVEEVSPKEKRLKNETPYEEVAPYEAGTRKEGMESNFNREEDKDSPAVAVEDKGETPQTGLVDSTPKSGTSVSTPTAQETEQTEEREKGEIQKVEKEKTLEVEESEKTECAPNSSKGIEESNIMGFTTIKSEQAVAADVSQIKTKPIYQVSEVPITKGGSPPEEKFANTLDTLLEEGENTPILAEERVKEEERQEDKIEEKRTEDELTSPVNVNGSSQLESDMESHPHQQQQDQDFIRTEGQPLCPVSETSSLVEINRENLSTVKLKDRVPVPSVSLRSQPALAEAHNINPDILSSGVLCLPGTRDKSGHALLTVTTRNTAWLNPSCNSGELVRIMVYFCTILRKEVRALGLTVLVDARRCSPVPALFKAFNILQEAMPGCIHTVLLLADRDLASRMEKPTSVQVELLTSLKSLHKHIDASQLPTEFDGTFSFSLTSWISFRMRAEQLTSHCEDAVNLLQSTISSLESTVLPPTAEEAQVLLCKYKELMRNVLEDNRLVRLQLEGGAALSRLRKEETCVSLTEDYRDAIEGVGSLYNQVDELVHKLVMLSNKCTQELEFIMEFKSLEEGFTEVRQWIYDVGEIRLQTLGELEDSLEQLRGKQTLFRDFYNAAYEHCKSGEALLKRLERWEDLSSAELQVYEEKVRSFWVHLHNFSQRVEVTKEKIDKTVRLYEFFDKAYEWALEGMRRLACVTMEDCGMPEKCQSVIACLEAYRSQHPPLPDERFQEMKDLAGELKSEQGLKQWKFAWSKCQETKQMFEKKLEAALRARRTMSSEQSETRSVTGTPRRHSEGCAKTQERSSSLSFSCRKAFSSSWARERLSFQSSTASSTPCSPVGNRLDTKDSIRTSSGSPYNVEHRIPQRTPLSSHRLTRSTSSEESSHTSPSSHSPSLSSVAEVNRRVLRKTQSFDAAGSEVGSRYGTCQRTLSEPCHRGNTGVFIKGLEVSSTEVADRPYSPRLTPAHGWASVDTHRNGSPVPEPRAKGSKLRHIVDEMVTTEREYVRSLRYIIDHYFPEMERVDLPQDLRGKRSVIFGNLEKLVDFHSQYFLKELESCCNHPLRVSHCFLRHQDQFGLYALYSKNKPKSDALLASHGNSFFRHKQLELEDKMDLASYLLKPIQRMSKYALLLKDLIKEVSEAQEQELSYLRAAAEMVKFQLRHGNDLLAMDAIRDCDVNLKEQGQLVRQDEFTIFYGRKKCQRHVFLFEDLVLFSKPKRIEGGLDVYIYKHSFKTADVGMTETSGESGLRFEIWFRRRTSKNQSYILHATTSDIKQAWTSDIARILWRQATRNKEIRMQEMVSMGVGNKPFLDIKPSDAAINDRAIDYIMKGRGARTRASIAVSLFDHSNPFKRAPVSPPVSGPPVAGGTSSSTLLGPLNLHMYSSQTLLPGERPLISPCIEEDELEHETSSQPSMTTESSGSSSHCLSGSGSSGSDSGCVSSHLPEALSEEPSSPCDTSCYSSITSPPEHKPCFNSQYISAKGAQVVGPSTIV